jgi:cytochrome c-type biogenesis protein
MFMSALALRWPFNTGIRFAGRARRIPAIVIFLFLALVIAQPVSGLVNVEYFHQQGCINCEKTDPLIKTIITGYQDRVVVESIEVDDRNSVSLLLSYGVTEIPVVVINHNKVLTYPEITPERMDAEIRLAESGAYPVPAERKKIFDTDNVFSLFLSFILGIMTALSPCLLGSLIVLIAAAGPSATGNAGKYYPLIFGTGILASYLLVAVGILSAGVYFRPDPTSRMIFYGIAGLISILIGMVQAGLVSLPRRMTFYTSMLISRFRSMPGIFLLGSIFAFLFAPCAIAPLLILIEIILINNTITPIFLLLAFSAGILTPFFILGVCRNSISEEHIVRYGRIVQKIGGLLLILLGIWLILSIR